MHAPALCRLLICALCLVRAEQFTCRDLRVQVIYFKCGCAARVVILEDFLYMHIIGQHKRLSLAREEGGSNKIRCRIRLVPAQINPWLLYCIFYLCSSSMSNSEHHII